MKTINGYVTVIGANLIEPILMLIEELETKPATEPNEVQTGQRENGFSCAIITLSVFLLESAINRTKYIEKDKTPRGDIANYISELSKNVELGNDVDEVIGVRDVIVHNHLWEAEIYWDGEQSLKFENSPKLLEGYGNNRFQRVLNVETRLSHRLGLNLFPPRIWRRDAYAVLRVVYQALITLETINHNYFTITYHHFMFSGELQTLSQILDSLPHSHK
jgi:hypothetical protein